MSRRTYKRGRMQTNGGRRKAQWLEGRQREEEGRGRTNVQKVSRRTENIGRMQTKRGRRKAQ